MKIPEIFILRISTNDRSLLGTYRSGRKRKYLLEKVLINFSYAKGLYTGGRFSNNSNFIVEVKEQKNYLNEFKGFILIFKRKNNV